MTLRRPLARLLFLAAAVAAVAGCGTTSQRRPVASEATLEPGNALIKVERIYNFQGAGRKIGVADNGEMVGALASDGGVLAWQRPAGELKLSVYRAKSDPLIVQVVAGKVYEFTVRNEVNPSGFGARFIFESK